MVSNLVSCAMAFQLPAFPQEVKGFLKNHGHIREQKMQLCPLQDLALTYCDTWVAQMDEDGKLLEG